ncbi:hypothetical protein BT96DRAFT_1025228 [Gymnopus androsaceus JB14]|uniref:NAD-specific glutamate dehydrogenase second domain-containing protein n=1 Tax=Gymnopus androsaceus JB14 TaxID=1447944 RepID=A0A6A4GTF5_9AGAR|nr:hypothetical protein BT96DRAFT_1025228 [Gymnopus androsaceus JB14]
MTVTVNLFSTVEPELSTAPYLFRTSRDSFVAPDINLHLSSTRGLFPTLTITTQPSKSKPPSFWPHSLSLLNSGISLIAFLTTNRPIDKERSETKLLRRLQARSRLLEKIVVKHCTVGTSFVARNNGDGLPVFTVKEVQSSRNSEQRALSLSHKVNWFYTNLSNESQAIDENGNGATFIHTSPPGITTTEGAWRYARVENRHLVPRQLNAYRLETFRSAGSISATASQQLRCYLVIKGQERVRQVLGKGQREKIMWSAEQRYSPVTEVFKVEGERERRLVIGYKMGGTTTLSTLSNLFHFYSLFTKTWNSSSNAPTVMKKASRLYCLPKDLFFLNGPWYSCRPGGYVRFGSLLNTCSSLGSASWRLKNTLDENDPAHAEVLINIKRRFRSEMFTRGGLFIII